MVLFAAALLFLSIPNAFLQVKYKQKEVGSVDQSLNKIGLKAKIMNFENLLNEHVFLKNNFIEFYAYLQVLLGKEESDNFWVVRDKKNVLNFGNFYSEEVSSTEECARRMWRLRQIAAEKGTKVFFVNPPPRFRRNGEDLSSGLPSRDYNFRQDEFLYYLQSYGVDYIDLRDTLEKHPIPREEYFYRTDHHWTVETSFYAYVDIINYMNERYNTNLDMDGFCRNIDNYHSKTYANVNIGYFGRKTGINFSGLDDFTVIWPKFRTNFIYEAYYLEPRRFRLEGPFERSLLVRELLDTKNPYESDFYSVYYGGIKSNERIININNGDGLNILMIRDSYSLPISAFMASLMREIDMLWPAAPGDLPDPELLIKNKHYDYIIVELFEDNLEAGYFNFCTQPLPGERR
jgi:hypothetical protein